MAKNLKVNVTADTSAFAKGMKQAQNDLRSLDRVSSDALGKLGDAIGIDTGKLGKMGEAARGLGAKLSECGGAGAKAFAGMLTSINAVSVGIAGLGIGAATLAFRALKSEAENFKSTIHGANIEMATAAYVDTYKQVLHDYNSDTGKAIAETESRWKKFWGTLGSSMKQYFATGAVFSDPGMGGGGSTTQTERYLSQLAEATSKATKAAQLQNELYALKLKQLEVDEEISKYSREQQAAMLDLSDRTLDVATRRAAMAKAEQSINDSYSMQLQQEKERLRIMTEQADLATNSYETEQALSQQRQKVSEVEAARSTALRSLNRYKSGLAGATAAAKEDTLAMQGQQAALRAMADMWDEFTIRMDHSIQMGPQLEAIEPPQLAKAEVQVPVTLVWPDTEEIEQKFLDITSAIDGLFTGMAEGVGDFVANLINGENAGEQFGRAIIGAFGDLAIAIGKVAIGAGTAALGLDALLKTPASGGIAIAAGAALVALGSMIKTSLSNIQSGNYGAASAVSNVASSSSSYAAQNYTDKEIKVEVTGTLVGNGSQLLAVLNNENNRKKHTT